MISKTTAVDKLRKFYCNRAYIFFDMRRWSGESSYPYYSIEIQFFLDALNDINYLEQQGELNEKMFILKM